MACLGDRLGWGQPWWCDRLTTTFRVFAFDDARVGPGSALRQQAAYEFTDGVAPERFDGVRCVRGCPYVFRQGVADDWA